MNGKKYKRKKRRKQEPKDFLMNENDIHVKEIVLGYDIK